jgi:hypothetical protein
LELQEVVVYRQVVVALHHREGEAYRRLGVVAFHQVGGAAFRQVGEAYRRLGVVAFHQEAVVA